MSDKKVTVTERASGGISFCGLLTIVFITLKLTGHIDWSWWWVWSPMWLPFAIFLSILLIIFVGAVIFKNI
jgi:hypothetical protein